MSNAVRFTITAKTEKVDGYAEMIMGILMLSESLIAYHLCKTPEVEGHTQLILMALMKDAPLGSLGLSDIDVCEEST